MAATHLTAGGVPGERLSVIGSGGGVMLGLTTLGPVVGGGEAIFGIPFSTLAPSGLAGICVLLVLFGRLVPLAQVKRERDEVQAELKRLQDTHSRELTDIAHDRDEWRAAHRISEQARLEERENNRSLVDGFGATLTGFLSGFRKATQEARDDDAGWTP